MKQTVQKKPKTFRTLIRRIHICNMPMQNGKPTAAEEKTRKKAKQPFFFFGR